MLAIIGGSGLTRLPELHITQRRIVRTPYGITSSPIVSGRLGSHEIVFLARHGFGHTIAPHEINYRANIWALHSIGVQDIISVSAVISLNSSLANGSLVLPHDLIDYTHSRSATFFEGQEQPVTHTDFLTPYSETLRHALLQHAEKQQTPICDHAVYGCLQGPRWPTHAEICRYRNDGTDILGMTGMPEAVLARELNINYAHLCGIIGMRCLTGNNQTACQADNEQTIHTIRRLLADL
ncbi:S-methyl-5'-thioinosine phosphorylase [Neisseria animalis]|uniref:S-methyl-5'-thioinosine phosphorylase n=1 Tax=Neisseria animalis TaxID=492 RepID=A0A5P3MNT3_NEIAN|nr:S-methyl-5'-thioinosine phosphorylase [Neisseria animalis]QEY23214.1 S-methyl-5'-thioinosine phosphorylase [Neisseria animalis]ROW31789.1 S-methyl-5'-thioinosine phosphorylase [Neisseria animalis]VEE08405.1 S-methyl-5'-thioinosine phosphorylase [Neisseria animalis]